MAKKKKLFSGTTTLPPQRKSLTLTESTGPIQKLEPLDGAQRFDISFASPDKDLRFFYGKEFEGKQVGPGGMKYYDAIRCDDTMNLALLNDKAPFLIDHRNSVEGTIGVVEKAYIQDNKARAVIRMSKSEQGQKYAAMIEEGVLSKVSLTYAVDKFTERKDLAEDGIPVFDTSITPIEVSLVAIPADHNVGFGKDGDDRERPFNVQYAEREEAPETPEKAAETEPPVVDSEKSEQTNRNPSVSVTDNSIKREKMTEEVKDGAVDPVKAFQEKSAEMLGIGKMYSKYGGEKMAYDYLTQGKSAGDLNAALMEKMKSELDAKKDTIEGKTGAPEIGLTQKEAQQFSFVRAGMAKKHYDDQSVQKAASFELAVMKAADSDTGWGLPGESFTSKHDAHGVMGLHEKVSTVNTLTGVTPQGDGDVANLRGVTNLAGSFVEQLYGSNPFMDLVTMAPGNTNSLQWAIETSKPATHTGTEIYNEPDGRTTIGLDKRTLDFQRMVSYGLVSDSADIMSAPAIEGIWRNAVTRSMSAAITTRFSNLLYTGGVALAEVKGDDPTSANEGLVANWKLIRGMLKKIESEDADIGTIRWFMHPDLFYHLAGVEVASGTNGRFIVDYERGNTIFGHEVRRSTLMKNDFTRGTGTGFAGMVAGDARQILFAEWGAPQLIVDESDVLNRGFYKIGIIRRVNEGLLQDKALVKSTQLGSLA